MTYDGLVQGGQVVMETLLPLPDGTRVTVEVSSTVSAEANGDASQEPAVASKRSFREKYKNVIGKAVGLPVDAASNVDHYLYGHSKQQ